MKIKTADLIGPALDWAVATIEGYGGLRRNPHAFDQSLIMNRRDGQCVLFSSLNYHADWSQGGPLLERECLDVRVFAEHGAPDGGPYWISERHPAVGHGPTPLIAAMRCVVASRLGDEVDVPDELV